jgi:hypothetical protein
MNRAQTVGGLVRDLERARDLARELAAVRGRIVRVSDGTRTDREYVRARDLVLGLLLDRARGRADDFDHALRRVFERVMRLAPIGVADDLYDARLVVREIGGSLAELQARYRDIDRHLEAAGIRPDLRLGDVGVFAKCSRVTELTAVLAGLGAAGDHRGAVTRGHLRKAAVATGLLGFAARLLPPEQRPRFVEEHVASLAVAESGREWCTYLVALLAAMPAIAWSRRRRERSDLA